MALIRLYWNRFINTDEISEVTFKDVSAKIRFKDGHSETLDYFSEERLTNQLRPAIMLPCPTGLKAIVAIEDEDGKCSFEFLLMVGLLWVDDEFRPACLHKYEMGDDWAWLLENGHVLSPEGEFADTNAWLAFIAGTIGRRSSRMVPDAPVGLPPDVLVADTYADYLSSVMARRE